MSQQQQNSTRSLSASAVVVVYNDYDALTGLVGSVIDQVDSIVIIDNSDTDINMPAGLLTHPKISYRKMGGNKGLSAGLNEGIRLCQNRGAEWVLLLDQDSTASAGMVENMFTALRINSASAKVGMLCPEVYLMEKAAHQYPLSFQHYMIRKVRELSNDVDFAITSGSLVKLSILDEIGFMDECFFIDYIDFDFCLKLRKSGYKICYVPGAILEHRLGELKASKSGIRYTSHSPFRIYYQTRNRLIVVRRYGGYFPAFAVMQIILFFLKFFKILALEDSKAERIRYYFAGIRDFFVKPSISC